MEDKLKIAYVLSIVAFLVSIYAKYNYIYLVLPLIIFIISLVFAYRGSLRGRLVWLGVVLYLAYLSLHYLINTSRNELACILAFTLFLGVIIIVLMGLDRQEVASYFWKKTHVRIAATLLVFNVFFILGEIPLYFILKYYNSLHEVSELGSRYLMNQGMYIFLDSFILAIISAAFIPKLIKGKPSGYALMAIILVMNTLLWSIGPSYMDILLGIVFTLITQSYPNMSFPQLCLLVFVIHFTEFLSILFLLVTFFFLRSIRETGK